MGNLVAGQVEKIALDTGLIIIDGTVLSPCEGDNSFVIEREYRDIPYNGMPGKTMGLKRILRENVTLTCSPKGLTQENLRLALPGAGGTTDIEGGGRQVILDTEYINEVVLVGRMLDGTTKVITLYNALCDNGLTLTMSEDSETVMELQFSAHYDPTDLTQPIYNIDDGVAVGTSTVTFTVSTSGTADPDLATVKFAGRTLNPSGGDAVFAGVAYGDNRPFEIRLDGHVSFISSLTVDSASHAVSHTLVEV